jgi:hypothetical protein
MKRPQRDGESQFLERVMSYRDEYRSRRATELVEERVRRHEGDEVYVAGCWILRTQADRVAGGLQERERLIFGEIVVLLVLLVAVAAGLWRLFGLLFLP